MERFLCRKPSSMTAHRRHDSNIFCIDARVCLWDTALQFLSPGPRNDVTDHLDVIHFEPSRSEVFPSVLKITQNTYRGNPNRSSERALGETQVTSIFWVILKMANGAELSWLSMQKPLFS